MFRVTRLNILALALLLGIAAVACSLSEGQQVDFNELGHRPCEDDQDCKPYAFCSPEEKVCVFECRTKEDCWLYMPKDEGYVCVNFRCHPADYVADGDTADGDEVDGDDGDECAHKVTEHSCRYWDEAYCTERSWVPWCGNSDCLPLGWRFSCNPDGKCVDDCRVDYGEVEEHPELASWTGTWGTVFSTAVTTTGLPLVGSQDTVSVHYTLDRVSIRDGKVVRNSKTCFMAIKNFKGEQIFDEDLAYMVIPQVYWENVALAEQVIENPQPLTPGLTFQTTRFWEVRGAILEDVINDDLPDRDAYNRGDDRIWDQDFDGRPAMTTLMTGVLNAEIYSSQRWSTVMDAEVVDEDHIIALNNHTSLQYQLDTHDGKNLYDQQTKPHDDADRSYYRMMRMRDNATCEDVIKHYTDPESWLYFTVRMDGVERPK